MRQDGVGVTRVHAGEGGPLPDSRRSSKGKDTGMKALERPAFDGQIDGSVCVSDGEELVSPDEPVLQSSDAGGLGQPGPHGPSCSLRAKFVIVNVEGEEGWCWGRR